ncbi:MAG: ATP-grasp domain-containing protein [Pseudomonadota bacterium]
MSHKPVLIAGFSGRALAQSARRAGFTPYVFDAYGDEDTAEAASKNISDPKILSTGFRAKPTIAALSILKDATGDPNPPLVLGAGFEQSPKLIAALEAQFDVRGCSAKTVATVKDPKSFFGILHDQGIAYPATLTDQHIEAKPEHDNDAGEPRDPEKTWLSKRIGGMGGLHIDVIEPDTPLASRHYAQERLSGLSISATALAADGHQAFAFTQSWIKPTGDMPFRYGGVVGSVSPDIELETHLVDTMTALVKTFELRGMVSFDFIVREGEAFLLEINPRPTAALDVLDDARGTLFKAHLAATAGDGATAINFLQSDWSPTTKAAAYLYADAGPLTIPQVAWPTWVCDRPRQGNTIAHHAPILTVISDGDTPAAAAKRTQQRLEHMAYVVYDSAKKGD